LIPTR